MCGFDLLSMSVFRSSEVEPATRVAVTIRLQILRGSKRNAFLCVLCLRARSLNPTWFRFEVLRVSTHIDLCVLGGNPSKFTSVLTIFVPAFVACV
jgi:hypothetical protein